MAKNTPINISSNLEKLLSSRNLGKKEADRIFSLTEGSVSKYTNGVTYPKIETMVKMAEFFQISLDLLVNGNVGEVNSQYDTFVKENHPDMVSEGDVKQWGENTVTLDETIFEDPKGMVVFLDFISEYHDKLKKKENIYKRFTDFIGKEYLYEKKLREMRGEDDEESSQDQ